MRKLVSRRDVQLNEYLEYGLALVLFIFPKSKLLGNMKVLIYAKEKPCPLLKTLVSLNKSQ
jgi:hypothetical protein